jgi:type IV pilus assembly protein PilW
MRETFPARNAARREQPARPVPGFTVFEILIAVAVALFAALAITQSFAVSEASRRSSTAGGDAMFSGALGIYAVDRDLTMAGYGLNTPTYLGCPVSGTDSSSGTPRPINFNLVPAQITAGASNAMPDQVTVVAGSSAVLPEPFNLTVAPASNAAPYTIANPFGVTAGDLLVVAQAGQPCTLIQSTSTPVTSAAGSQNIVSHASGTYRSPGGATVPAPYNPAGGIGPAYSAAAVLLDLGPSPWVNTYRLANGNLVLDNAVNGVTGQLVAANIVQFKAYYGHDTAGSGSVGAWDQASPGSAQAWSRVLAVRLALVARSANPEKPVLSGAQGATTATCTTTTTSPVVTWEDASTTVMDVTAVPNWQCYRYRVFHLTVSLRNLIWTPS